MTPINVGHQRILDRRRPEVQEVVQQQQQPVQLAREPNWEDLAVKYVFFLTFFFFGAKNGSRFDGANFANRARSWRTTICVGTVSCKAFASLAI
jgi:hypothetical protein